MTVRYRRNPNVLWRRTAAAVVALVPGTSVVVTLEGTGVALWDALGDAATLAQVVDRLADRYATGRPDIARDVERAIRSLVAAGLLAS